MDQNVEILIDSIKNLKNKLEAKEVELRYIQKHCNHIWPNKWSERVGRDYGCMSGAVDSVFRQNSPEIIAIQYKNCELCGKEKIKK